MSPVTFIFIITTLLVLQIVADNTTLIEEGDPCTTSDDCNGPNEDYDCQSGLCMCNSIYAYIPSESRPMCLAGVSYGYNCKYDEQCQYHGSKYACVASSDDTFLCLCAPGYIISDYHCIVDVFWTPGKITGLAVGCVVAFFLTTGLCACLMYYSHKKSKKQEPVEQPEPLPSVSKITEEE